MPSSVEWWFQNTKLVRNGSVVLETIGSWENIINGKIELDSQCNFALLSDSYRCGDISTAPVYVLTRPFIKDGSVKCYDISYWLFYPFNGNIFDGEKAALILGGAAGGLGLLGPLCPLVFGTSAVAAGAAAVWISSNPEIGMHEGDWEHVTVRITEDGELLAVVYVDHGQTRWFYTGQINSPYGGRMYYPFEGTRPLVYIAVNSHASYPILGRIQRLAGFANDSTGNGMVIDALAFNSPGLVYLNPGGVVPDQYGWVNFPGRWGRQGDKPSNAIVQWIGEKAEYPLVAVGDGPKFDWLKTGDKEPDPNWDPDPKFVIVNNQKVGTNRILSAHSIFEHLYLVYLDSKGECRTILFDGTYWESLPDPLSKYFYGCEDVEVFQIGGKTHAIAACNGNLIFGIQQNNNTGNYQVTPWTPDVFYGDKHILKLHCISPIGSTEYYTIGSGGTKHILTAFLRKEPGYDTPFLTILEFDGQYWVDVSPGDWFSFSIDPASPLDICVFNGKLILGLVGEDKKSYFFSCVPTYATSGGLRNWKQLKVCDATYTSISIISARESFCVAAQTDNGALEICVLNGDPEVNSWGMQAMPRVQIPRNGNLQLASISTLQNIFLFLPRLDGSVEYASFFEMPV